MLEGVQFSAAEEGILRFYWRVIIRPHFWLASILVGLMLFSSGLEMVSIGLAVPLLEVITDADQSYGSRFQAMAIQALEFVGMPNLPNVVIMALLTTAVTLFVISGGVALLHQYLTAKIAHKLQREMRTALFERFLYARYGDVSGRGRGDVLNDVNVPSTAVYSSIRQLSVLCAAVVNSIFLLALMLFLSWPATLLISLVVVFGVRGLRKAMDDRANAHGRTMYQLQGERTKVEIDSIDGLKVVKTQGLEATMVQQQKDLLEAEIRPTLRLTLFRSAPLFLNEAAAAVIVLFLAGITFLEPSVGMGFPTLVVFLLAIRKSSPAVASMNSTFVDLNMSRKSVEMIEEILHKNVMERRGHGPIDGVREVVFSNVGFSYPTRSEESTLVDINMTLCKGTITAIVGTTGAGKSTVADLLLDLYTPTSGKILVDGVDLQEIDLTAWRKRIGYVSQDVFLFNASILTNITSWEEGASPRDVQRATRLAGLHDFVDTLPNGYDTLVGDRGVSLSGGQRQRIAVARAILRQPEVLVFDEATSALDAKTEKAVYDAISTLRQDAIVLVIAHRLSTVRQADRILVLDSGRVRETGTHDSLMRSGGIYANLYEMDSNRESENNSVLTSRETPSSIG